MTTLKPRDIVIASFPQSDPQGREQEGLRPAVILGLPSNVGKPRFNLILVAPMTTAKKQLWVTASQKLYPVLAMGAGGLPSQSVVLLDQARFLDIQRIGRQLGQLTAKQYAPILEGFKAMLEIED
jgi:mRNA interferase MazF